MTMPAEYVHASKLFDAFIADAQERFGHSTRNQTYTTVEAVLLILGRRLQCTDAIVLAKALPPVLRAIFIAQWSSSEPRMPFATIAGMNREVQEHRQAHNFSPGDSIEVIAKTLRAHTDPFEYKNMLSTVPDDLRRFLYAADEDLGAN